MTAIKKTSVYITELTAVVIYFLKIPCGVTGVFLYIIIKWNLSIQILIHSLLLYQNQPIFYRRGKLLLNGFTQEEKSDFLNNENSFGQPAIGRPNEAAQFDFLIGEWTAYQQIQLAPEQWAKFPSNSTAVYVLNGQAVMEHNWYNVDSSLPEAATTIVLIYNRAMRRWECMYLTNRFNSILYFGGVTEGDEIILTPFDTDNSLLSISYFTFYDIDEDSYQWHARTSNDRGETFTRTWTINSVRKTTEED